MRLLPRSATRAKSSIGALPLPFRGLNTRDQLTELPPDFALTLDNLFSENGRLSLRNGYEENYTGLQGDVDTLMYFDDTSADVFAATDDGFIYDITGGGSGATADISGLSGSLWDWTNFAAGGDNYLFIANGADAPRHYNGTTWTTPTITGSGLTASDLKGVISHKSRLWFIEDGTLSGWYLGSGSISGSATEFIFGRAELGGELAALATWSRDGGDGPDDYFVAITTNGEVFVYAGTDPSSANTWGLVGRYRIALPIGGTRCTLAVGGDLLVMTRAGLISMTDVVTGQPEQSGIAGAIKPDFIYRTGLFPTSDLWNVTWQTAKERIIVNVPNGGDEATFQFVFSLETRAWTRVLDIPARCWLEVDGTTYFGAADGTVYALDSGYDDNGSAIDWEVTFSPNRFGSANTKHWARCRLHFMADGPVTASVEVLSDYARPTQRLTSTATTITPDGATWDVSLWDVSYWAGDVVGRSITLGLTGGGVAGALRVAGSSNGANVALVGAEMTMEVGREL